MKNAVKSVAAIHDLSGYGRCSLSVISPVLSVMGIQSVAVPTAVLSTHTVSYTHLDVYKRQAFNRCFCLLLFAHSD